MLIILEGCRDSYAITEVMQRARLLFPLLFLTPET